MNKTISYAQNGEDIVLARALSHVNHGFYIDIGAWDPVTDSVSKLFYDNNWCGINIDPFPDAINKLNLERPRDKNLQYAVSNYSGKGELIIFPGTGWHTLNGNNPSKITDKNLIEVEVRTLNEIMEQFNIANIHWLKIDAEGSETEIISAINFIKIRPWIMLIEATLPNTPTKAENKWVDVLTKNEYEFCFFDGLNEFWVAKEHNELKQHLSYPAGVHDNFIKHEYEKNRIQLDEFSNNLNTRCIYCKKWGLTISRIFHLAKTRPILRKIVDALNNSGAK